MTPERSARSDEQAATLELRDASFCGAGRARTAPLSLCSVAHRVGLVGPWQPLFEALTGDTRISAGSAQIFGCNIERALATSSVGLGRVRSTAAHLVFGERVPWSTPPSSVIWRLAPAPND